MTESQLTLFAGDSPVKISVRLESKLDSRKVRAAVYGRTAPVYLGKFDQNLPSLKTSQTCLMDNGEIGLSEFCGIFPRSGTMRNGTVFQHPNLAQTTTEIGSGLLPTPNARDGKDLSRTTGFRAARKRHTPSLATELLQASLQWTLMANAYEQIMGLPLNHTEID